MYPAALQQVVTAKGWGLTVANAGYSGGLSFDGAFVRYRQELHQVGARLVLYGVFPGNDYRDFAMNTWTRVDSEGYPVRIVKTRHLLSRGSYAFPLLRESRLFVGLYSLVKRYRLRDELEPSLEGRVDWGRVELAIRGFSEDTKAHDAQLVFLFLHDPYDVHAKMVASQLDRTLEDVQKEVANSNATLQSLLDRHGVPWLDTRTLIDRSQRALANGSIKLMPSFAWRWDQIQQQSGRAPNQLAGPDRMHYSWMMNVLIGQWLYGELRSDRLLPEVRNIARLELGIARK